MTTQQTLQEPTLATDIANFIGQEPEKRFDRITRTAASHFSVPVALISLSNHHKLCCKSSVGWHIHHYSLTDSFCGMTMQQQSPLIIENASEHAAFAQHPFVTASPSVTFYAGVPLRLPNQKVVGTLCIIDFVPREFSDLDVSQLEDFAYWVETELALSVAQIQHEYIQKTRQLSQIIAELQRDFILDDNRHQAFEKVLKAVIDLMACEYGFIGEVLYDAEQKPFLKTYAITNIAWDCASQAFYDAHAQVGLEFRNLDTLFGHTLKTGQIVITNNPSQHPASAGLPHGHPAMNAYLGLPIFFGSDMVAMLGLANKQGGFFEHDIDYLKPLQASLGQLVYASRLRAQQRNTQHELDSIIRASGVGTWSLDIDTQHVEVNERWFEMLGFSRHEVPEVSLQWIHQRIHPDDLPEVRQQLIQQVEKISAEYQCEFRIRHKQGHWVWLQARGQLLQENVHDPQTQGFLYGLNIDISQQKQLEWKLSRLANHIPGLVYQLQRRNDGSLFFSYAGASSQRILGFTPDELYHNGELAFARVHPDDVHTLMRSMAVAEKHQQTWKCSFRLSVDGNTFRWLSGQASPELIDANTTIWHGYIQDVSEEMAMQVELENAKQVAEESVALKARFLANMSHEIRTPMNGIVGLIDLMEDSNKDDAQTDNIELLRESAYSLLTIIDDILDFSKLEAGKLQLSLEPHPIAKVIDQVASLMDLLAAKSQVELYHYCDVALCREGLIDAERLRQILINLVNNAIKFSSKTDHNGVVLLSARLLDQQDNEGLVEIRVSDNGIGMSSAQVSELFQPFTQADPSTSRKYGGTGLGLAISHQLTHLMNGVIRAESKLGEGSQFVVTLPVSFAKSSAIQSHRLRHATIVMIGNTSSVLLNYLAQYLLDENANVVWQRPEHVAPVQISDTKTHAVVYLIDLVDAKKLSTAILERIRPQLQKQQGILLLGRGKRRKARQVAEHVVHIDANSLQRDAFIEGVTLAIEATNQIPAASKTAVIGPKARGKSILVLEDNTTNQLVIEKQLTRLGYCVDVADNGAIGFNMASTQRYDLILSDLHMPEMDGVDFTIAYRAFEKEQSLPEVPIIALTANIVQSELDYCKQIGMNDYLIKPLPIHVLKTRLDNWLSQTQDHKLKSAFELSLHEKGQNADNAMIDLRLVADMVGEENVKEIVQDYVASASTSMRAILQALEQGDIGKIVREAHKLKSSSRFVGAASLADLFVQLEALADEDINTATLKAQQLCDRLAQENEALSVYVNGVYANDG